MDGFTIFDGIVGGVIVISAILAYARGFIREVMSIVGWIAAAIIAFIFAPNALPLVLEIPYLGDFIGESRELGILASFAIVFVVALVVVSLFTPLFSSVVQRSPLGGIDAGLGFLFGVARGVLLVVVALIAYDRIVGDEPIPAVSESRSAAVFANMQESVEAQIPSDMPGWILDRYETLIDGSAPAVEDDAAVEVEVEDTATE
ncbi:CvpA family protein [Gymnodinialimonas ceratoperidinii]|uniref:CvpA family protein n=1 Tax=Gymnodinialimonas ceratoperidinii TaxID=2856823 RepID=A0A8F6TVA4_9RHOB|nr:CvpA family protein [Gymnodinialimonas ceratoperidinii]QXT38824.1 CvpA family protein [Gymnodinialimonas ceratoperidinii]